MAKPRAFGSRTRASIETQARQLKVRLSPSIEVEGREAMREIVASGAGIGFVSQAEFGHDHRLAQIPIAGMDHAMSEAIVGRARRNSARTRAVSSGIENGLVR